MGTRTAFFYGTLMAPEILYRVCYGTAKVSQAQASLLTIVPAILHNHCRHKVLYCDYPGVIPEEGHSVRGTFVTGLTDHDIFRLDIFEGSEYSRQKVEVVLLENSGDYVEGAKAETETYIFIARDGRLEKAEWDYESFRREKMHRWADHSDEYVDLDEADKFDGHDPTGGRGVNRQVAGTFHGQVNGEEGTEEMIKSAV